MRSHTLRWLPHVLVVFVPAAVHALGNDWVVDSVESVGRVNDGARVAIEFVPEFPDGSTHTIVGAGFLVHSLENPGGSERSYRLGIQLGSPATGPDGTWLASAQTFTVPDDLDGLAAAFFFPPGVVSWNVTGGVTHFLVLEGANGNDDNTILFGATKPRRGLIPATQKPAVRNVWFLPSGGAWEKRDDLEPVFQVAYGDTDPWATSVCVDIDCSDDYCHAAQGNPYLASGTVQAGTAHAVQTFFIDSWMEIEGVELLLSAATTGAVVDVLGPQGTTLATGTLVANAAEAGGVWHRASLSVVLDETWTTPGDPTYSVRLRQGSAQAPIDWKTVRTGSDAECSWRTRSTFQGTVGRLSVGTTVLHGQDAIFRLIACETAFYRDADGDQFGDADGLRRACAAPEGYVADSTDCLDSDPLVHAGAPERCNGLSDNCDEDVDEGNPGSGGSCNTGLEGVCAPGTLACSSGDLVCQQDTEESTEACNGLDDDCDGNEDNVAKTDLPLCALQLGVCKDSRQVCEGGAPVACRESDYEGHDGRYEAVEQTCDGLDNDCDDSVDETVALDGSACDTHETGVCAAGVFRCRVGNLVCEQTTQSSAETCNGLDDDCNGTADDGLGTLSCGVGACARTVAACESGQPQVCSPGTPANDESCGNGIDDDCDTQIDESPPCQCVPGRQQACYSGIRGCTKNLATGLFECQGECTAGTQTCGADGKWEPCSAHVVARVTEDSCDGKDEDCTGIPDDTFVAPLCPLQEGVCSGRRPLCAAGVLNTCAMVYSQTPSYEPNELTCDGRDNDCDGVVDDVPYLPLCENQRGVCQGTQKTCANREGECSSADYQAFTALYESDERLCDGLDNDCDGKTDEMQPAELPLCENQAGVCAGARKGCFSGALVSCDTKTYVAANPAFEAPESRCDGLANDCDGVVDPVARCGTVGPARGSYDLGGCGCSTPGGPWFMGLGALMVFVRRKRRA